MAAISASSDSPIEVSVILPIYNEVGHLETELDRIEAGLTAAGKTYELVVIDDGSTDGSAEILHAREGIRLTAFASNRGSGSARRIGTAIARGDVVVWTDVDMTYPNDKIAELVDSMDGFDHAVGARTTEEGTLKFLRAPAKWFIRLIAQILAGRRIPDLNSGFRAFRRDVAGQYLHLLPDGFSCVTTLTLSFLSNGYTVNYVDIPYAERAGVSKFHWWTDTRKYLLQVVRMVLMFNPLKLLGPIASMLLLVGFGKLLYDVISDPWSVAINTVIILVIAAGVLGIGLVSDLLVQLTRPRRDVIPATITSPK